MASYVPRTRVNGATLNLFHGKPVCLLAQVVKADGGGMAFQVKASDGVILNIRLKQPISEPPSDLVEIYGIGQGKNLILADSFHQLSSTAQFDMNTYNDLVNLINYTETNNPYKPVATS